MKQNVIFIYIALLWLLFGLVYLYPHPEVIASDIALHADRNELDNYLISGMYTGWYTAIAIITIGLASLLFGLKRQSLLLLNLSIFIGISYTYYTTRLEVFIEQSDIAIKHGVSIAVSGINVILKHQPDFVFMELLFIAFATGGLIVLFINIKHITNRSTTDAPKRRAR